MERYDRDLSADTEFFNCFFDTCLDMLELGIDSDTESLEYSLRWILVIARSPDDLEEIERRIDGFGFSSLDDGSGYMDGFFLISVAEHQISELVLRGSHHEISSCTASGTIEPHIEWSIVSDREPAIPIVIVSTTHTEIIEDEIDTPNSFLIEDRIDICETRMYEIYLWWNHFYALSLRGTKQSSFLIEIVSSNIQIVSISVDTDEPISRRHMGSKHTRVPTEPECRIDHHKMCGKGYKYHLYLTDEDWIVMQNKTMKV